MTHPKLILNRMQFFTIHLQLPGSKYAPTRSYEFGHYRSFWQVNKSPFFVKASYMNMEDSIEMRQKGFLRGHLEFSKKSKNTSLGSKLKELWIGEVDLFCKIAKIQMCSKMHFLLNGPNVLCLNLIYNVVHDSNIHPHIIFFILQFILILY